MDPETTTSDTPTLATQLAQATQSLADALSNLDGQFSSLHAKIDRIIAAVDDGDLQASAHAGNALQQKVAELEKANVDLKAQSAAARRKTLSPMVTALLAKQGVDGDSAIVRQEFSGGRSHELQVNMPAVIGVQSARQPPRYAPISRIKQAMQTGELTEVTVSLPATGERAVVRRMHRSETNGQAEMLTGNAGAVADQIVALLRARGLVKG